MAGFADLQEMLTSFYEARDWRQFQTPKDVAAALAIEASELQELFLWLEPAEQERVLIERRTEFQEELADVIVNCLNLAYFGGVDLESAVKEKLTRLATKYPADAVRGKVVPHQ